MAAPNQNVRRKRRESEILLRVALADDSGLFRHGLSTLLREYDVTVTAEADTGDRLIELISHDLPDVVILDIRMPPTLTDEGIVTGKRLRELYPNIPIMFLSAYIVPSFFSAFSDDLSSIGYLSKDRIDIADLIQKLREVIRGEVVLDPEIVKLSWRRKGHELDDLSSRELQILRLMAAGRSNAGIAEEMHISLKSVESYIATIYHRLKISGDQKSNRRVLTVLAWLRSEAKAQPD